MVCAGLDTVLRCLLYRDEVSSSEWILFNHQLGLLARVPLAFFSVAVPVVAAIWDYYGLCWVRHHSAVLTVLWCGPLQWVNPLQPSIRSAGQSFFSLLLCCCSSSGRNMELLWFPSLSLIVYTFSWMTSLMTGTFRSSCRVCLVTYQGAFLIIRSILDWLSCILTICELLAHPHWHLNSNIV
jgi:hypothetical protein